MQLSVKFMLVATLGFALPTPVQAGSRELLANRNIVETQCGANLQSNGGVIGCTKACPPGINGTICDYSCGGPEGPGCRIIVMTRVVADPQIRGSHGQKLKTGTR